MEKRSRHRIRDLVALTAIQGPSQNEIGCARISVMARSKSAPFKGRTPDHHIQLAMHGRSIHKCRVWTAPAVQERNLMFPQNCEATNGLHLNLQVRRATLWPLARNKKIQKICITRGASNAGC
jgi:hypothetical protein